MTNKQHETVKFVSFVNIDLTKLSKHNDDVVFTFEFWRFFVCLLSLAQWHVVSWRRRIFEFNRFIYGSRFFNVLRFWFWRQLIRNRGRRRTVGRRTFGGSTKLRTFGYWRFVWQVCGFRIIPTMQFKPRAPVFESTRSDFNCSVPSTFIYGVGAVITWL